MIIVKRHFSLWMILYRIVYKNQVWIVAPSSSFICALHYRMSFFHVRRAQTGKTRFDFARDMFFVFLQTVYIPASSMKLLRTTSTKPRLSGRGLSVFRPILPLCLIVNWTVPLICNLLLLPTWLQVWWNWNQNMILGYLAAVAERMIHIWEKSLSLYLAEHCPDAFGLFRKEWIWMS